MNVVEDPGVVEGRAQEPQEERRGAVDAAGQSGKGPRQCYEAPRYRLTWNYVKVLALLEESTRFLVSPRALLGF